MKRKQRWWIMTAALLVMGALAALGTLSFQRRVEQFQPLGFEAQRTDGVWHVRAVDEAFGIGLEAGDEIYQVAGREPAAAAGLRSQLRAAAESELLVLRAGELLQTVYYRPPLDVDFVYLVLCFIGAIYLLIGLFTLLKDTSRPGRLFFLWSTLSAALYVLSPLQVPTDRLDELVFLVDQVARTLLAPLTLHLFLVFPGGLPGLGRIQRLTPFLYLPAAVLLAVHGDWMFNGGGWLAGAPTPAALAWLDRLDLVLLTGYTVAGILALAIRLRTTTPSQRRQMQWIVAGLVGGYLPFVTLYVVPRVLGIAMPDWFTLPAALPLALVPLGFAYAILKYKLWDIGGILRDAISYSVAGLIGVFGFVLINLGISRGIEAELTGVRNLLSFVAGIGIAGILVPVRGIVASRLERFRFGDRLAQRRALSRLGQQLVHERDLDQLCLTLVHQLRSGLDLRQATLYLAEEGGLVPARPDAGLPRTLPHDALGASFWYQDHAMLEAVALPGATPTASQHLFAAGYRYAFPLRVRDRDIGIALIGHHADGAALASEDLALIRSLFHQAGLALENARLLDEVRCRLREVTRLEAHNKGIIESSPAGIAVVDRDGRVSEANLAFAAVVGVERLLVEGRALADLIPVRPLPTPLDGVMEVSYCQADGTERYLQMSVAEYHGGGDDDGLQILLIQDASERIALEAAMRERERLASLGMVAAGVAHEVNTPLTGISSYAQILLQDIAADDPHRATLEKMERQTFRASEIVNKLLAFARSPAERRQPMVLSHVVRECVDVAVRRAADADVELTFEIGQPDAAEAQVVGHAGELAQVFNNLISNAIEVMAGQPARRARHLTLRLDAEPHRVHVTVQDTGPGIAPARIDRVFQPFFSSKLESGGTGLGLAISYNIVRRHGGEIRVENQADGTGCSFVVTLSRSIET